VSFPDFETYNFSPGLSVLQEDRTIIKATNRMCRIFIPFVFKFGTHLVL
jgi:hypothetical protein